MTTAQKARKIIRVSYWRGTMRCEGFASTYRGARRIANRNSNAYPPLFFEAATGDKLYDIGRGLIKEDADVLFA